jgi:hypothetical protein
MLVDNEVVKKFDGEERYDKKAMASSLYDISFKGATCSLLEMQQSEGCGDCILKAICKRIDEVVEEFTENTTIIKESFSFGE